MVSEGAIASGVRGAASAVGGAAGAYAGAGVGAELGAAAGTFVFPGVGTAIGGVVGGIGGAILGAYGGNKAEQAGKQLLGLDDSVQLAADEEAHPYATFTGELATGMAGMNPMATASKAARVAGIALGGGMEAGQEKANGQDFDPLKIAMASLAFGIAPATNKVGAALEGAGRSVGSKFVPGRPNQPVNPASAPAHADVGASQAETAVGDSSTAQQPIVADGSTTGNPQSAPARSSRTYPKDNAKVAPENDMLTQGDMDPATAAALKGEGEAVTPEQSPLGEQLPQEPSNAPSTADVASKLQAKPPAEAPIPGFDDHPSGVGQPARESAPVQSAEGLVDASAAQRDALGNVQQKIAARNGGEAFEPEKPGSLDPDRAAAPVPKFDEMPDHSIEAGFPEPGQPVAVGENDMTPQPKRDFQAAAANAEKPKLTLKGKTNHDATPAQKEAGNYEKAGERLLGHDVKYENMKGSTRKGVGPDGTPWESTLPADYGYFKKTVGADKDHVDVYNLRNGDKHYIVDQKNPETGKFDEHKVMANAKDLNDARDTYLKGFSDDKALARLHDINEIAPEQLQAWLKTASKKKPYGAKIAPEKAAPKVVSSTVEKLRAADMHELADKLQALPKEQQPVEAARLSQYLVSKTGKLPETMKNVRIRTAAVEVPGADGVTARSKGDAEKKGNALKAVDDLFEAHAPKENETAAETVARAQAGVQKAQVLDKYPFTMAVKQAPALWVRAAKQLGKKPSPAKINEFLATEKALRSGDKDAVTEVRSGQRTDADIGRSKRSGDDAVNNAEAKRAEESAGVNTEEDEMLDRIDAKRKDIKSDADLPKPGKTLDMDNAEHRKELARTLTADLTPTPKWKEARDAQRAKIAESAAKQLADRQAAAAVGDGQAVRPIDVKKMSAEEKAELVKRLNAATQKKQGLDALPAEREGKKGGIKDLLGNFINNEDGSLNTNKIMADLKKLAGSVAGKLGNMKLPQATPAPTGKPWARDYTREPKAYHSQKLDTPEKAYNSALSDGLHTIDTQTAAHDQGLVQWQTKAAKELDPSLRAKLYFAHEEGKLGTLTPEERASYDKYVKPLLDENDGLKTLIQAIDPTKMGPDVLNHIYRVVKGVVGQDPLKPGVVRDPLGARNNISQRAKNTLLERGFVALERDADGKRFVIQPNDDGYLLHMKGKVTQITDPSFKFSAGGKIDVAGNKFTMKDALTREIEANARNKNGNMMRYHHDAVMSAALANKDLAEIARHMTYVSEMKNDPRFTARATMNGELGIKNGWEHPKLPELEKYWVDPRLKAVLDDYAKPGFDAGRSVDAARQLSQAITKTIFWNPVIHPLNVAGHWFVGRGWDNLNVKSLVKYAGPAFKDVLTQGPIQKEIAEAGGSIMYGQTLTKDFVTASLKALGHEIKTAPATWDPIAKKLGVGPSTLVKSIYDNSQKIMWAANDMMYTHMYLEAKAKGMSPEGAVKHVEKDIPNYRVTPTLAFGNNHMGRVFSQAMQDPLLTSFGRYHAGIWNAYANTVHDLIGKDATGTERVDAVGKLMAMGALMFVAKPLADLFAKKVSGNDKASEIPRGPLTIPANLAKAARGEDDVASALRATTTLSPFVSMALQLLHNKDFADRDIIDKGDVRETMHGNPKAAARVGASGVEFVARNAISPLNVAENEEKKPNGSILGGIRDQLLGIKNPSPKASKFEAEVPKKAEQSAVTRFKQGGRGILEGAVDKLGFK